MLPEDPQLGSTVLGATTASDQPATESGIDPSGRIVRQLPGPQTAAGLLAALEAATPARTQR